MSASASAARASASPRATIQFRRSATSARIARNAPSTTRRPWRASHTSPGRVSRTACHTARGSSAACGLFSKPAVRRSSQTIPEPITTSTRRRDHTTTLVSHRRAVGPRGTPASSSMKNAPVRSTEEAR